VKTARPKARTLARIAKQQKRLAPVLELRHNGITLDASPTFPPKPPPLVDLSAALEAALFFAVMPQCNARSPVPFSVVSSNSVRRA
jgi:hypothetical protein